MSKNKINMKIHRGVWIASVMFYGVELICTGDSVSTVLRGLQSDMKYVEENLYHAVIRSEKL